jgi:site-specific recombinase XerD
MKIYLFLLLSISSFRNQKVSGNEEKKGIHALKSYLAVRPDSISKRVFLNYQGEPISERGIRKLVVKYRKEAGITKKASCHTLRHTFATCKAEKGVSAYQLQQWLGHANLNTT